MESATTSPSSIDDVFRTEPTREPTPGRSRRALGLFRTSSPDAPVHDTHSWKDKFSNALSMTGFRSRSSRKKGRQERQSDPTANTSDVPPLPEFLRNMISGFPSASTSGATERSPPSPTRERLSRFFSHQSGQFSSPPGHDNAESDPVVDETFLHTSQNQPLRPQMRERVSTIADRKITQAIPRDSLSGVTSHPYGMSSHLSFQDPDFPISK